jgi:hypothetical protein
MRKNEEELRKLNGGLISSDFPECYRSIALPMFVYIIDEMLFF